MKKGSTGGIRPLEPFWLARKRLAYRLPRAFAVRLRRFPLKSDRIPAGNRPIQKTNSHDIRRTPGVPSGQKSKPSSGWISAWLRPLPCPAKIPLQFLTGWSTSFRTGLWNLYLIGKARFNVLAVTSWRRIDPMIDMPFGQEITRRGRVVRRGWDEVDNGELIFHPFRHDGC